MPPRKKPNSSSSSSSASSSSSKKSNPTNQPQPSKFGIQHFFERHTQNALLASQNPKPAVSTSQNPATDAPRSGPEESGLPVPNPRNDPENAPNLQKTDSNQKVSAYRDPKKCSGSQANDPNSASQNTPTYNIAAMGVSADENLSEVSPEVSKSVSLKRFKFSPGMVKLHWKIHCSSA
jgi:DNA replication ATP-dependent helicase Dna2